MNNNKLLLTSFIFENDQKLWAVTQHTARQSRYQVWVSEANIKLHVWPASRDAEAAEAAAVSNKLPNPLCVHKAQRSISNATKFWIHTTVYRKITKKKQRKKKDITEQKCEQDKVPSHLQEYNSLCWRRYRRIHRHSTLVMKNTVVLLKNRNTHKKISTCRSAQHS